MIAVERWVERPMMGSARMASRCWCGLAVDLGYVVVAGYVQSCV